MILGEFGSDGLPVVESFLTLPRFNVTRSVCDVYPPARQCAGPASF